jgi:hypothetical protein
MLIAVAGPYSASTPDQRQANLDAIMAISLGLVERCDAILMIGESPGANRERDLLAASGKPVYTGLDQVPDERNVAAD